MLYPIKCPCGGTFEVAASSAGGHDPCPKCGSDVPIPRLSRLREAANLGAFESSALDTLERLRAEGQLPGGKVCVLSGRPTSDWVEVEVSCERPYLKTTSGPSWGTILLLLGPIWALFLRGSQQTTQHHGHKTDAFIPLRVDRQFHAKLARRWSRRRVLALLKADPLAARLLAEYPMSRVVACRGTLGGKPASPGDDLG